MSISPKAAVGVLSAALLSVAPIEAVQAQILVNPNGVNVNAQNATTVFQQTTLTKVRAARGDRL